jgi:hypothetical protein
LRDRPTINRGDACVIDRLHEETDLAKKRASSMTDKELARRLFAKSVRKELKALLSQTGPRKRAKAAKKR